MLSDVLYVAGAGAGAAGAADTDTDIIVPFSIFDYVVFFHDVFAPRDEVYINFSSLFSEVPECKMATMSKSKLAGTNIPDVLRT